MTSDVNEVLNPPCQKTFWVPLYDLYCVDDCGDGLEYSDADSACMPCPKGKYRTAATDGFECKECPVDRSTESTNSKSSADCIVGEQVLTYSSLITVCL